MRYLLSVSTARCARRLAAAAILSILLFPVSPRGEELVPTRVFKSKGFNATPVSGWDYDTDGDGKTDYRRRDGDGDGVIDHYLYDWDLNGSFESALIKSRGDRREDRHLVVFLDSIPFSLMKELWDGGHFRDFHPPGRMISPFPSHTNPAFTEILGTEMTPGIEDRYYDRLRDRVTGGFADHMGHRDRKTDRTFHAAFDYEQNPRYGGLIYLAPYAVADHDLKMAEKKFWKLHDETPSNRPIVLYVGSTDAIGHREGYAGFTRQLLKFEKILDRLIHDTKGRLRVSLVSDHGNNLVRGERLIDLDGRLEKGGFRLTGSLKKDKDVVAPCLGLLNVISLYTGEENKEPLSDLLTTLDGVDFAVYRKDGRLFVSDREGSALILTEGNRHKYEIVDGDPLELREIMELMRSRGEMDEDGFAGDTAWFEATKACRYPDILRRLVAGMSGQVVNRPDLFLSLEDGYCYGTPLFLKMIDLKGTHGSALDTSTYGIVMSTEKSVPPYVRAADVMDVIGEKRISAR